MYPAIIQSAICQNLQFVERLHLNLDITWRTWILEKWMQVNNKDEILNYVDYSEKNLISVYNDYL